MNRINKLVIIALTFSLAGCVTLFGGKSDTRFQVDVSKVYDASLNVLQEENLPIVSKSLSKDAAQIDSEYPNGTPLHICVRTVSLQYAEVNIRVGAIGDDYRAYELMKKIESNIK